jgi:hypothetical protein
MGRDRTARNRIRQHLRDHGAIDDPGGYATSALKDAIGYQGTGVAFIQLIAAMERDGEIARDIRGKRTYRIAPGQADQAPAVGPAAPAPAGRVIVAGQSIRIDPDRLARAVAREFFHAAAWGGLASAASPASQVPAERDEYALLRGIAEVSQRRPRRDR